MIENSDCVTVYRVQDMHGDIKDNEYHVVCDCTEHAKDQRRWWEKLSDWWAGRKWTPIPLTITVPSDRNVYHIKKIDATSVPVLIATDPKSTSTILCNQFEEWTNECKDQHKQKKDNIT